MLINYENPQKKDSCHEHHEHHLTVFNQPSCPKVSVQRLTAAEINTIKSMYLDKKYFHYSITALAMKARAVKNVFASASTWSRVIKQFKISRINKRIYPCRPKTGIRASSVNQIWHLDQNPLLFTLFNFICFFDYKVSATVCFFLHFFNNFFRFFTLCLQTSRKAQRQCCTYY